MCGRWGPALVAMALLAPQAAGAATITPVAQERFVQLADLLAGTEERIDATDFGDFDASLGVDEVSQHSTLSSTRIQASVAHDIVAEASENFGGFGEHYEVESSFSLTFDLDESSLYQLSVDVLRLEELGHLDEVPPLVEYSVEFEASLAGPGGAVFDFEWVDSLECSVLNGPPCSLDLHFLDTGVLAPGTWTLTARSHAVLEGGWFLFMIPFDSHSDGIVSVDLVVPEPDTPVLLLAGLAALAVLRRFR